MVAQEVHAKAMRSRTAILPESVNWQARVYHGAKLLRAYTDYYPVQVGGSIVALTLWTQIPSGSTLTIEPPHRAAPITVTVEG